MSWLFGMGGGQQQPPPGFPPGFPMPPPGPPGDNTGDGKGKGEGQDGKMEAYRFDSAALERAANAAKELERNRKTLFFLLNNNLACAPQNKICIYLVTPIIAHVSPA
jgi:hypothetical protein